MTNYEFYFMIGSILGFVVQVIILVFSLLYYLKLRSIDGLLMTIGSLLGTLIIMARPLLSAGVAHYGSAMELVGIQGYLAVAGGLFATLFTIGFAMAILKMLKNRNL